MKTYLVGGAVRDALMGHAGSDRDWVVVGGTPEALVAQGYQPVGRDFPVFLHPTMTQAAPPTPAPAAAETTPKAGKAGST